MSHLRYLLAFSVTIPIQVPENALHCSKKDHDKNEHQNKTTPNITGEWIQYICVLGDRLSWI